MGRLLGLSAVGGGGVAAGGLQGDDAGGGLEVGGECWLRMLGGGDGLGVADAVEPVLQVLGGGMLKFEL